MVIPSVPGAVNAESPRRASYWVDALGLLPHPEGGWYRETYRSPETIPAEGLPERFAGPRSFATAIYYLLDCSGFSAFHRIASDEMWHFHAGSPLTVHVIDPAGTGFTLRLGGDPAAGQTFQGVVPAGCWFAAETAGDYSLVGCTVAPGFEFADFLLGSRTELLKLFPQHEALVTRLTRG